MTRRSPLIALTSEDGRSPRVSDTDGAAKNNHENKVPELQTMGGSMGEPDRLDILTKCAGCASPSHIRNGGRKCQAYVIAIGDSRKPDEVYTPLERNRDGEEPMRVGERDDDAAARVAQGNGESQGVRADPI